MHEWLRRIDNAHRVRLFFRVALKEAFIDGVEKGLLLVKIGNRPGGVFDGDVKVFEALDKIVAAEGFAGEHADDFLDLLRDDVTLREVREVEDFSEDTLGEQVLDEHILDGLQRDVRIQRAATKRKKIVKGADELGIGLALLFDKLLQAGGDLRTLVFEFLDGFFPFGDGGRREFQKQREDVNEVVGLGQVGFVKFLAVLVKHSTGGLPEKNIFPGVAERELGFDFFFEVIVNVLGLPQSMIQTKDVEK